MTLNQFYPIGTPGHPWSADEKHQWQQSQTRSRSYQRDVLDVLDTLQHRYDVIQYGELRYADDVYPLMAVKSKRWDDALPVALVTGGVHGYETSGVMGALTFLSECQDEYAGKINLLVAPCISPWAYEHIARWNFEAVDPNRQFFPEGAAEESQALMRLIVAQNGRFAVHVDLHETTDTDESEFSPARSARDGVAYTPENIPDGYYLVSNTRNSRLDFQSALIAAVAQVTHIAPSEPGETVLGYPVTGPGIVEYDNNAWHLCSTITDAPFTTTTEVYPDSADATPEQCTRAQVVTVRRAIEFALSN